LPRLAVLEGKAQIQRTHGGAMLTERMILEFDYREQRELNGPAKRAIAAKARELVEPGQRLILDTGCPDLLFSELWHLASDLWLLTSFTRLQTVSPFPLILTSDLRPPTSDI
jgi:DeoR/GlpR family transcriptional regulator of sugar metabolism